MTNREKTAQTGEGPAERVALEWMVPEDADQRAIAREAVDALFAVAEGWIEVLGLELRLGCYDRETFGEADVDPPRPYHLLVREPRAANVSIDPTYRAIESGLPAISRGAVAAFVEQLLAQPCGDPSRHETGLGALVVRASRTPLPEDWGDTGVLSLDCYAGTVAIPVEHHEGETWIAAPPYGYLVHQPVALSVMNTVGWFRLAVEVYWSPWVGEAARRGGPLYNGISRLEARGWTRA